MISKCMGLTSPSWPPHEQDGEGDEVIIINVLWVQTFHRSEKSLGSAAAVLAEGHHFADACSE